MKNAVKKALSIMLVAVMLFGVAPLNGFVGLELPDWLDFSKLFDVDAEASNDELIEIVFDLNGGLFEGSEDDIIIAGFPGDEIVAPGINSSSVIKDGYVFVGWYDKETNTKMPSSFPNTDTTYIAVYSDSGTAQYAIKVYIMDTEGNYKLAATSYHTAVVGTVQSIAPGEWEGCTIDTAKSNLSGMVSALGDTVLEVYYARNIYTVTYIIKIGHNVSGNEVYYGPIEVYYGADIPVPTDPISTDKSFFGWYPKVPESMPAEDLVFNTILCPEGYSIYTINTYFNDELQHIEVHSLEIGQSATVMPEPYLNWVPNSSKSNYSCIVLADGTATINIYYTNSNKTSASISYYVNGELLCSEIWAIGEEIAYTDLQPCIEGYVFLGWDKPLPATMPEEDLELNAVLLKEGVNIDNGILRAFSSKPELRLGENDEFDMLFEVETEVNEQSFTVPGTTFAFTSSDTNVFTVDSISNNGNQTSIKLNKKGTGSAILSVTAYYNGEYIVGGEYLITSDGDNVYYADTVPQTNGFNFISNGIVVDGFKCEKEECVDSSSPTTYAISFNAYNQANCIGSADVYNKDGELLYSKSIAAFTGNIPTGIWDTVKNLYEYFSQEFLKDSTYKDSINSEKTEICFANVPADGYISISNDVNSSMPCALYNISSLFVRITSEALSAAFPKPPSDDVINSATEALTKKILPEMLKSPATSKTIFKILEKFCQALSHGSESKEMDAVVDDYILLVDALNIDVGEILIDCAIDAGIGVVEGFIYVSLGPAGGIIKTAFKLFSLSKIATHIETLDKFVGSGKTAVYLPSSYPQKLYSNGYSVSSQLSFDSNITFHKYGITTGNDWNDAKQTFSDMKYIDVIGMDLYKDGIKVQPSGMVEVAIPIPDSFSSDDAKNIKVYRKESDGSYTELNCDYRDIANGYIYIKTDHFSVYCIVLDEVTELIDITFESAEISISIDDYAFNEPIFNPTNAYETNLVWSSSDENVAKVTDSGFVVGISLGTTTITATANDNVYASYVVNVEPVRYNIIWEMCETEMKQTYEVGSEIVEPADPKKIGYTFIGWTPAVPDIMPAEDLTFTAVWSVNNYKVIWIVDGEKTETSVAYGEAITAPTPEKTGYKFVGWDKEIPAVMSAEDLTFTAIFEKSYTCPDCGKEILGEVAINEHVAAEARMKATVEIKNNNGSNTIKYGETLRLTAITNDMPADVIVCWYVNGEKKGEGETFDLSFESGTKTVEVKLVDAKGNVLKNASGNEIKDTETVTVKAGFFQKLISFFKKLFGISQTVVQSIYF